MNPDKVSNIRSWVTSILSILATVSIFLGVDQETAEQWKGAIGSSLEGLLLALGGIIAIVTSIIEYFKYKKS